MFEVEILMAMTYCSAPWAAVAHPSVPSRACPECEREGSHTLMGTLGLNRHLIQAQIA